MTQILYQDDAMCTRGNVPRSDSEVKGKICIIVQEFINPSVPASSTLRLVSGADVALAHTSDRGCATRPDEIGVYEQHNAM